MSTEMTFSGESLEHALAGARTALLEGTEDAQLRFRIVEGSADAGPVTVDAWAERAPALARFEADDSIPVRSADDRPERGERRDRGDRGDRDGRRRGGRREGRGRREGGEESRRVDASKVETDKVDAIMNELLEHMGFNCQANTKTSRDRVTVQIVGDDAAELAAAEGNVVDAIQVVVERALSRVYDGSVRLSVQLEGYRSSRDESLHTMALELAERVRKSGKTIAVDPMNARDRRVMHMAVATIEGVSSKSEGEGARKRLLIVADNPEGDGAEAEAAEAAEGGAEAEAAEGGAEA